jgi:hypothetical protein
MLAAAAAIGLGLGTPAPAVADSGTCRGYQVPFGQVSPGSSGVGLCYLASGNFGAQWRDSNGNLYYYDTGIRP